MTKPTGHTIYAKNLLPYLRSLAPTYLSAQPIDDAYCYPVPPNLTPEQGTIGHLRRNLWTQQQLPRIYKKLRSRLLFSPIPEAPLQTDCRSIVTVHDLIPLRFPRRRSPLTAYCRYFLPQVLSKAQHILCDSTATATDITEFFFGIPIRKKFTPILLAYDANHFRPQTSLSVSKPYFLYIGRHDPYKNLHRLIDAFAALPGYRDYELWIAGPN